MTRLQSGMRPQPPHGDDWLITYADMITLLLCFFVVMFILSSSRKNEAQDAAARSAPVQMTQPSEQVQTQRKMPRIVQRDQSFPAFYELDHPIISLADEVAVRIGKPRQATAAIGPPLVGGVVPVESGAEPTAVSIEMNRSAAVKIVDEHEVLRTPSIEPKGDRITTLEMSSFTFFDSGSATLSENGKSILRDVAIKILSNQYEGYQITVEGYTDDTPIATPRFSSNWELSTARAVAVVHFFLDQGVPARKLRAAGYADTYPKVPNRDSEGDVIPENQAQNRRVVIKLEKTERSE